MRGLAAVAVLLSVVLVSQGRAQDDQTLADIRQELSVLYVEVQKLKRELSTTTAPSVTTGAGSVLDRVAAIEAELQRLTAKTENLDFRIQQIVEDGTNRIGDLEFRLVELEGGDVSQLGETTTLGGDVEPAAEPVVAPAPAQPATELAVGEQADFDAAKQALGSGDFQAAADRYAAFQTAYPGSPLLPEVLFGRGQALEALGDTREAARAYLDSYSANSQSSVAPDALAELGAALGALGQVEQACVTLAEVGKRYPGAPAVAQAEQDIAALGCS
ncbi:MAG: tol-pal system protein YbgF [Pseudomonadota bacterium]